MKTLFILLLFCIGCEVGGDKQVDFDGRSAMVICQITLLSPETQMILVETEPSFKSNRGTTHTYLRFTLSKSANVSLGDTLRFIELHYYNRLVTARKDHWELIDTMYTDEKLKGSNTLQYLRNKGLSK